MRSLQKIHTTYIVDIVMLLGVFKQTMRIMVFMEQIISNFR